MVFSLMKDLLFEPRMAFMIFIIFIILYLVFLDEEGAFKKKFLKFGPDPETKFLNMKIDTWKKVILVYVVGFLSALLQNYYGTVMYDFIHSKLWNPAYKERIPISKTWAQVIVSVEPLLYWLLNIIEFFVSLTMQLQFLIPQFLGQCITGIPYGLMKVNEKSYTK